jgi:hypothetical protein
VVNQGVLAFAQSHIGQEVGNGQCTDLVDAAYAAAGAESESKLGPTGPDADYVWGTPVDTVTTANHSLAGVLPGDVIQFRDVTLVHTTTYPDGSWYTTTKTADHHTAIVESVSGSTINVLEQNVGSANTPDSVRYTVQRGTYDLDDLQSGTMWIYQPISLSGPPTAQASSIDAAPSSWATSGPLTMTRLEEMIAILLRPAPPHRG